MVDNARTGVFIVIYCMGDFLWDSALVHRIGGDNRIDVIPDYQDDMSQFCITPSSSISGRNDDSFVISTDIQQVPLSQWRYRECMQCLSTSSRSIDIEIAESRGNGVLDIIGGELWQGSLVLCAYLLRRVSRDRLIKAEVLELGSGVGLPAMLLIAMKSLFGTVMHAYNSNHDGMNNEGDVLDVGSARVKAYNNIGRVVLTDNDSRVMDNLWSAINKQFDNYHNSQGNGDDNDDDGVPRVVGCIYVPVAIHRLDWRHPVEVRYILPQSELISHGITCADKPITTNKHNDDSCSSSSGSSSSSSHNSNEDEGRYRIIIGSELCYSLSHASYLSGLIQTYLLSSNDELRYHEIIICQVKDREGFTQLLALLDAMAEKIVYTIDAVDEQVFKMAQQIGKCHAYPCTNPGVGVEDDEDGSTGSIYRFPADVLHDISSTAYDSSALPLPGDHHQSTAASSTRCSHTADQQIVVHSKSRMDFRSRLISTDIAAFAILRVKAI